MLTNVQSLVRRQDARRFLVETYANEGLLLALPGTIQNRSGWYEVPPDEAAAPQTGTRAARFEVTGTGEWLRLEGPISKAAWRAQANSSPGGKDAVGASASEAASGYL